MMINWSKSSRADGRVIHAIIDRCIKEFPEAFADGQLDRLTVDMDLTACHCSGCPLDLQKLLAFPPSDFAHDIFGIYRHINVETGALRECFTPRCAVSQ